MSVLDCKRCKNQLACLPCINLNDLFTDENQVLYSHLPEIQLWGKRGGKRQYLVFRNFIFNCFFFSFLMYCPGCYLWCYQFLDVIMYKMFDSDILGFRELLSLHWKDIPEPQSWLAHRECKWLSHHILSLFKALSYRVGVRRRLPPFLMTFSVKWACHWFMISYQC